MKNKSIIFIISILLLLFYNIFSVFALGTANQEKKYIIRMNDLFGMGKINEASQIGKKFKI